MTGNAVAAIQFEPEVGEIDANLRRMDDLAESCPESVELAVYPELSVTGYDLHVARTAAEPVPGALTDRVRTIARDRDLHILAGLPERAGDDLFNAFVHVSPAGVESVFRKRRLWGAEAQTFAEGTERTVCDTPVGTVGLLICYDLNFPELSLEYAKADVDILAVSSAWRTSFLEDWRLLLRARALDGTCYTVGSNHIGDQRGREHAGHSIIAGPTGSILEETDTRPGVVSATVSTAELDEARERNPVRRDR